MRKTEVAYNPSVLNKLEARDINGSTQPQNVKSGRVYVFGKDSSAQLCIDDDEEDDTLFEMVKIRPRKGKKETCSEEKSTDETIRKVKIIDRQVFPNDTLSKFALQYGCTVAELKKVNNLYNEQDFHALKHIKIPIQPHSLLTERAEEEKRRENAFNEDGQHSSRHSSQGNNSDSDYDNIEESSSSSRHIRTVSISANLKDAEKFLKKMDDDIQKICQSVSLQKPDLNDVTRTLTTQCIRPRTAKKSDSEELGTIWTGFGWKGADRKSVV